MYLSGPKCSWAQERVTFLGFDIDQDGMHIKQDRVKVLQDIIAPTNVKEAQSLIGMFSYYRRFIPSFSLIVAPIIKLFQKGVKFVWDVECEKSLKILKEKLTNPPCLAYPDFSLPFQLVLDASYNGTGSILMQRDSKNRPHIISCDSRALTQAQRMYSATELEMLALIRALETHGTLLIGGTTTVFTDSLATTFIQSLRNRQGRLYRWSLIVSPYRLRLIHLPGKKNPSDFISRIVHKNYEIANPADEIYDTVHPIKTNFEKYFENSQNLPPNRSTIIESRPYDSCENYDINFPLLSAHKQDETKIEKSSFFKAIELQKDISYINKVNGHNCSPPPAIISSNLNANAPEFINKNNLRCPPYCTSFQPPPAQQAAASVPDIEPRVATPPCTESHSVFIKGRILTGRQLLPHSTYAIAHAQDTDTSRAATLSETSSNNLDTNSNSPLYQSMYTIHLQPTNNIVASVDEKLDHSAQAIAPPPFAGARGENIEVKNQAHPTFYCNRPIVIEQPDRIPLTNPSVR